MTIPRVARLVFVVAALSSCASSAQDRPLTPEEKQRFIQRYQTEQLRRDQGLDPSGRAGCSASDQLDRLDARQSKWQGASAFDSRLCAPMPSTPAAPAPK